MSTLDMNPAPWYMGHGGTATAYTKSEAQKFARSILESKDYRDSLELRVKRGELPPAVETMLWNYAFGKPTESINLKVETEDLSSVPTIELMKRYEDRLKDLREVQSIESAIPVEVTRVA